MAFKFTGNFVHFLERSGHFFVPPNRGWRLRWQIIQLSSITNPNANYNLTHCSTSKESILDFSGRVFGNSGTLSQQKIKYNTRGKKTLGKEQNYCRRAVYQSDRVVFLVSLQTRLHNNSVVMPAGFQRLLSFIALQIVQIEKNCTDADRSKCD